MCIVGGWCCAAGRGDGGGRIRSIDRKERGEGGAEGNEINGCTVSVGARRRRGGSDHLGEKGAGAQGASRGGGMGRRDVEGGLNDVHIGEKEGGAAKDVQSGV